MTKHHEAAFGSAFGCLSLRSGLQLFAAAVTLHGLCGVLSSVSEDVREYVGGYSPVSSVAVIAMGLVGTAMGMVGMIGLNDNHHSWVKLFTHFVAFVRVPVVILILVLDWRAFKSCGRHLSHHSRHLTPALHFVAVHGECHSAFEWYTIYTIVDLLISLYGVSLGFQWCNATEQSPLYNISLDEEAPLKVYTGYRHPRSYGTTAGATGLPRFYEHS
mmetsp:Transcript_92249/g.192919  ORF Transcript_92249/g.192919 Transcript_92249/m.192919 type:complete len:216 (-) Transcript_92249:13-660(-)